MCGVQPSDRTLAGGFSVPFAKNKRVRRKCRIWYNWNGSSQGEEYQWREMRKRRT